MATKSLSAHQKSQYLKIVKFLWSCGPQDTSDKYPQLSVKQLVKANAYYDSLRCEGCWCGSCVGLGELSSNLTESPESLKPIANLAIELGKKTFAAGIEEEE